jgi:nicotinamide-nucleotide adenylyltransferase
VEQVHITGFDTLTRIFTSRYYPKHDPPLSALEPFLSRHRIHATVRVESSSANDNDLESEFGTVEKQKGYLDGLARGSLEDEGLKREWVDQVQLAVDESGEAEGVSSTSARECVKNGENEKLEMYVGEGVKDWILDRGLYRD